jgi:hypothetical protein
MSDLGWGTVPWTAMDTAFSICGVLMITITTYLTRKQVSWLSTYEERMNSRSLSAKLAEHHAYLATMLASDNNPFPRTGRQLSFLISMGILLDIVILTLFLIVGFEIVDAVAQRLTSLGISILLSTYVFFFCEFIS